MALIGGQVVIDGSHGEEGGQILRTSLAISAISGRPLVIERIRANRRNPGLAAQHVTGVLAAAELCAADVEGATIGSVTRTASAKARVPLKSFSRAMERNKICL